MGPIFAMILGSLVISKEEDVTVTAATTAALLAVSVALYRRREFAV